MYVVQIFHDTKFLQSLCETYFCMKINCEYMYVRICYSILECILKMKLMSLAVAHVSKHVAHWIKTHGCVSRKTCGTQVCYVFTGITKSPFSTPCIFVTTRPISMKFAYFMPSIYQLWWNCGAFAKKVSWMCAMFMQEDLEVVPHSTNGEIFKYRHK